MEDLIPRFLFFLQSHSVWLPFTHLEITYQGNLYPIVLPREEKRASIARGFTHYGVEGLIPRFVIMQNVLRYLHAREWVTFTADVSQTKFVQYACFQSPQFSDRSWLRFYLSFVLIRIPRLYPRCYYLDFVQPRTRAGRARLLRAIAIARRHGCTPSKDAFKVLGSTGKFPRPYFLLDDVPKHRRLWISCGTDYEYAANLGDTLLAEVFLNQDPVTVRIGEWGK